jgi:hypothetical protein
MATVKAPLVFPSWGAFLDQIEGTLSDPRPLGGDATWGGTADVPSALEVARYGWGAGLEKVRAVSLPAVETITAALATSPEWSYDLTGADYDVGEYLTGVPECWLHVEPTSARPCVRLLVNVSASCAVTPEGIQMRGAAVVALALGLQGAGYAVEVTACMVVDHYGDVASMRVPLTDGNGGPLDADRLLFALAHPAMLRRLGTHVIAHHEGVDGGWVGVSQPADPPKSLGWVEGSDLYLPRMHADDANFRDPAAIARWVADVYASITEGKGRAAKG